MALKAQLELKEALSKFDRSALAGRREKAEEERQEIVKRFPIADWPKMPIEDYALGQANSENTFCRWLEFRSMTIAGIRGGSAMKHMLFKRKSKPGWYFDKSYKSRDAAWQALRAGFVEVLDYAKAGEWDQTDGVTAIYNGPALRLKTLYVYFPNDILPICTASHIKHYLQRIDSGFSDSSSGVVRLNRLLRAKLVAMPEFKGWTMWEIAAFLYFWAHPREAKRIVKIAPGEGARYWDDCLSNGYICVGWDKVGDLTEFDSKEELKAKFQELWDYSASKASTKVNELWTLRELEPGDIVVANRGISQILAVGEVQEAGYAFRADREEFKHTLEVKWDTSVAKEIPPQKSWAFTTVSKVSASLYDVISKGTVDPPPSVFEPIFIELEDALLTRGQVLMHGPPGTGKTFHARRMTVWWLLRQLGRAEIEIAAILDDSSRLQATENTLTHARNSNRTWYVVANPQVWNWSQLKKEKRVDFHYGRLQRNYPLIQAGDLVIGYLSGASKQITAIARVSRGLDKDSGGEPSIELEYVHDVVNGLTYEELLADPILANSEPLRFRNQGTLFAITETEADHLLSLLLERDPTIESHLGAEDAIGQLTRVTFHPSYSYEDFIEGFRPVKSNTGDGLQLRLEDGIFKRVCRQAQLHPEKNFIVIIDEINRANVSKVFGELITLIEKDKRGMIVTLSQSKESFHVPANVYIIGTMNTSDRSIRLLDAAFRRRFAFVELMPDTELFSGIRIGPLAVDSFLAELNKRITRRFGREKQIGHSFFIDGVAPIEDADVFANRFRREVLPLLQEYCFDDYAGLTALLGSKLVDEENQELRHERINDSDLLLEALVELSGPPNSGELE
jgi:5-methylcytosine-specific restriction protein B